MQRLLRPFGILLLGLIGGAIWIPFPSTARAGFTQQGEIVIYTPSNIPGVSGQLPFAYQFVLGITSPGKLKAQESVIALSAICPTVPGGVDAEFAKLYATFSTSTLTYTGPNQQRNVVVTIALPSTAVVGNYAFKIRATGWEVALPAGVTLTNNGCDINITVSRIVPPYTPPQVSLQSPANGGTVITSAVPASVPFSFSVTAPGPTVSGISSLAWDLDGSPVPITITSLVDQNSNPVTAASLPPDTVSVTGTGTIQVQSTGQKKVSVRATNLAGTQSGSSNFTVQLANSPPVVQIDSPAPDAVFAYDALQERPLIPFGFTATSAASNLAGHAATLNGAALQPTIVSNSSGITGTLSNLPDAIAGTNTLIVTATDAANRTSAPVSSTFIVNPISVTIADPAQNPIVLSPGVSTTSVGLRFSVTSGAGQPVSAVTAKLADNPLISLSANVGASSVTATGTMGNLTIGEHTVEVTGVSSGVAVTRSRTFRVKGTPSIQWVPPAPIVQGTPLSVLQLGASANVPGNFVYSHAMGTVLDVGTHLLTATFTPADPANYVSVSAMVSLRVNSSLGALNGFVFLDLNGDGIAEAKELGLPGIPVQLRAPVSASADSGIDGVFGFSGGSGLYDLAVTVPPGMRAIGGSARQVVVSGSTSVQIGLAFDFDAIRRMDADGASIGFWKNNLEKLRDGEDGTQISAADLGAALAAARTLALEVYNGGLLTSDEAIRLMSSNSPAPLDLLQKQLVAAELNCGAGYYIGGSGALTRAFIAWGEMLVQQPGLYERGDFSYAKEWLEAYNRSGGGQVKGPKR